MDMNIASLIDNISIFFIYIYSLSMILTFMTSSSHAFIAQMRRMEMESTREKRMVAVMFQRVFKN